MFKTSELNDVYKLKISHFLLGSIFSRIIESENKQYFLIPSSFKKSKKTKDKLTETSIYKYIKKLNKITNTENKWISEKERLYKFNNIKWLSNLSSLKCSYIIENDLKISKNEFLKKIYFYLLTKNEFINVNKLNEQKKFFIRGFIETRGSIDLNRKYISIDYFYENQFELRRAIFLIDYLSVPTKVLNINFRELQNEFYTNCKKRNTQLRIKLEWYIEKIGIINDYKRNILLENGFKPLNGITSEITYFKSKISFNCFEKEKSEFLMSRIDFYSNNVLEKKLTKLQIKNIKNKLKLNIQKIGNKTRNFLIKEICRISEPNFCSGCKDKYNIKDRSFVHLKTSNYYFEIHHNIPFSNGKEYDVLENLIKLCPTCHKMLKRGIAKEEDQKTIIKNILKWNETARDFASYILNLNNINELTHKIWEMLK